LKILHAVVRMSLCRFIVDCSCDCVGEICSATWLWPF